MKINLYCDVLMVPPAVLVKAGKAYPYVQRFVKTISLPTLLVPGQTYYMECDLVTGAPGPTDFSVIDSGVFEDGDKQIPYIVLKDDFWLAFDPWLKYEAMADHKRLPQEEQITIWRKDDSVALEKTTQRFLQNGWELCPPVKSGPMLSRPSLEY
jgi:hypothetical protein